MTVEGAFFGAQPTAAQEELNSRFDHTERLFALKRYDEITDCGRLIAQALACGETARASTLATDLRRVFVLSGVPYPASADRPAAALAALYRATGDAQHLESARFFAAQGDPPQGAEAQSEYYAGLAQVAAEERDGALIERCNEFFAQQVRRRGDLSGVAAFGSPRAAVADFCLWMAALDNRREYHDVIERALFNGSRPVDARGYLFGEESGCVYVNQYLSGSGRTALGQVTVESAFPYAGRVRVKAENPRAHLKLRVPYWCDGYAVHSGSVTAESEGYLTVQGRIELDFCMRPRFVYPAEGDGLQEGRKAILYGPNVLCARKEDNGGNLRALSVPTVAGWSASADGGFCVTLPAKRLVAAKDGWLFTGYRKKSVRLRLVPAFGLQNDDRPNRDGAAYAYWFL